MIKLIQYIIYYKEIIKSFPSNVYKTRSIFKKFKLLNKWNFYDFYPQKNSLLYQHKLLPLSSLKVANLVFFSTGKRVLI